MANVIITSLVEGAELFDLNNNSTWEKTLPCSEIACEILRVFVEYIFLERAGKLYR